MKRKLGPEILAESEEKYKALFDISPVGISDQSVTELKSLEVKLKASEEKYKAFFENSLYGMMITSQDGSVYSANKASCDMLGYTELEICRLGRNGIIEQTPKLVTALEKRRKSGKYQGKLILKKKDGTKIPVELASSVFNDFDGGEFTALIIKDITKRRNTEISLRKSEERIKQSKDLLAKLNQRLDEIRENEQLKISRDLHDQLGQSLTAIKIDLDMLLKDIPSGYDNATRKIKEVIERVTSTSMDVQRISSELRPPILDDLGLASAVEWYCEEFGKRSGLNISVILDDVQTNEINKDLAIYRVLQESFTNIARHAMASNVYVKLYKSRNYIVLLIKDDGIGIPVEKINSSKSLGLLGMSERLKQVKGRIEILSPKKGGTIVRIYMPTSKN